MVTQLLRSPVLNAAGEQVGRVEDFIAKLADSGYPPITGLKVGVGGHDVFVGLKFVERLEPNAVKLNISSLDMTEFQRDDTQHQGQAKRKPSLHVHSISQASVLALLIQSDVPHRRFR